MPLVKKPAITERKIAANQRNGRHSQGPATPEGKERSGAARLRHGLFAQAQDVALRCLGEDAADFEELVVGLRQEFTPKGALQEKLVARLARVLCLVDRSDRSEEGQALRRAKSADRGRDNRLHARMMRLKMTAGTLQSLAKSVARDYYVTRPNDLELMKGLQQEEDLAEMGDIAFALFCQLQDPGAVDAEGRPVASQEAQRRVLLRIKEIFGLAGDSPPRPVAASGSRPTSEIPQASGEAESFPAPEGSARGIVQPKSNPYPHITAEQWEEREPVRQLLENILTHQADLCEAQRQALLKEAVEGPSPYELAAEIAPCHADALQMRRIQDANLREVRRLTNLLLKVQSRERKKLAWEADEGGPGCHDMSEKKDLSGGERENGKNVTS